MPKWPIYTGTVKSINNSKVRQILQYFDNPQDRLKNIFHIGGTNGKGSTASFVKSILRSSGYTVNCYTSPHLIECNERINLNGHDISDEELTRYIDHVKNTTEDLDLEDPTIFEAITIACILAFVDKPAQYNIFEVGMGGLNDATNVFKAESLAATIINVIGYDHAKFLGEDLFSVSIIKSHIMKPSIPAIIAPQKLEAMEGVLTYCNEHEIKPSVRGYGYMFYEIDLEDLQSSELAEIGIDSQLKSRGIFEYAFKDSDSIFLPKPSLRGSFQVLNASLAITAIKEHQVQNPDCKVTDESIARGLVGAKWPARIEKVTNQEIYKKLPRNTEVILDGAHNPLGASALNDHIEQVDTHQLQPKFNIYIVGKTIDTDIAGFIESIEPTCNFLVAINSDAELQFMPSQLIYQAATGAGLPCIDSRTFHTALQDISAIYQAGAHMPESGVRIIICGSLYLAMNIKQYPRLYNGELAFE